MKPRVVICGTYHQDIPFLTRIFRELETTGCRILSPLSLDFVDATQAIVRAPNDYDLSVAELEKYHLRCLRDADFVWLHCPNGYVGVSAAYELGYAGSLHKPIFCFNVPQDDMLAARITVVASVFEALQQL